MNDYVKVKIKWKNKFYKTYAKSGYKCNDYDYDDIKIPVIPPLF